MEVDEEAGCGSVSAPVHSSEKLVGSIPKGTVLDEDSKSDDLQYCGPCPPLGGMGGEEGRDGLGIAGGHTV